MRWNNHSTLAGKHAFLSASSYHWVNYDDEKLDYRYLSHQAAARGTRLHVLASDLIREGIRQARTKAAFNMYVNDAIGFRMDVEKVLFYSDNCFGTADAISFRKNKLRISDYKSGVTPASMMQLVVYAALFCLEYDYRPGDIQIELRIYQEDEIKLHIPEVEEVIHVMDRIVHFDRRIEQIRAEQDFQR